jgi:hypothetical protein
MHSVTRAKMIILTAAACLLLIAVPSWFHYEQKHAMGIARPFTVGDASVSRRVLIATQHSAFKDTLVAGLIAYLRPRSVYVQVIDISGLPQVQEDQWTAIVVLHTWQFGKPPSVVPAFIAHTRDRRKLVVLTTSGSGHARLPGVDAISSASVDRDVPTRLMEIIPKLDGLLGSSK